MWRHRVERRIQRCVRVPGWVGDAVAVAIGNHGRDIPLPCPPTRGVSGWAKSGRPRFPFLDCRIDKCFDALVERDCNAARISGSVGLAASGMSPLPTYVDVSLTKRTDR